MSDLMTLGSMSTAELRTQLAEVRNRVRHAKADLDDLEHAIRERILTSVGGNPKEIGSNEQLRDDRYRAAYSKDRDWLMARANLMQAQDSAEVLQAIVDGRTEQVLIRQLDADEARTQVLYRMLERQAVGL